MNIYTKTGDEGETGMLGGKRVGKHCLEMDAIGEVDELNAALGMLAAELTESHFLETKERLEAVQHALFTVGANLAAVQTDLVTVPKLTNAHVQTLERWIDDMERDLPPITQFILPGGDMTAANAFYARAVCRRAERRVAELKQKAPALPTAILQYLNRLSDCLFVLGRWINKKNGVDEVVWKKEG